MGYLITQLQQELGSRVAARVIEIAGGERLHVPGLMEHRERLTERFGDEIAVLLVRHFGDSRLAIPVASQQPKIDDDEVLRLTADGRSANQIARRLRCTVRTVHKSRARSNAARYVMGRTLASFSVAKCSASFAQA